MRLFLSSRDAGFRPRSERRAVGSLADWRAISTQEFGHLGNGGACCTAAEGAGFGEGSWLSVERIGAQWKSRQGITVPLHLAQYMRLSLLPSLPFS